MIDFDALVLAPTVGAFARPVRVNPGLAAAFDARGVWASRSVDVATEDGGVLNTRVLTLGIRLSEWQAPPKKRMRIEIPAAGSLPAEGILQVDDVDLDGQGGASLTLKRAERP